MRFVEKRERTPCYERAVEALGELPPDLATRAFAEATQESRETAWVNRYGLKRSSGHPCVARLLGKRCREHPWHYDHRGDERPPCRPPGCDHATLWLRDGGPAVYVFQPYGIGFETTKSLVEFCDQWGLAADIKTWPASHFPGSILWVEITPRGRPLRGVEE